jgi:hypothetical protein
VTPALGLCWRIVFCEKPVPTFSHDALGCHRASRACGPLRATDYRCPRKSRYGACSHSDRVPSRARRVGGVVATVDPPQHPCASRRWRDRAQPYRRMPRALQMSLACQASELRPSGATGSPVNRMDRICRFERFHSRAAYVRFFAPIGFEMQTCEAPVIHGTLDGLAGDICIFASRKIETGKAYRACSANSRTGVSRYFLSA